MIGRFPGLRMATKLRVTPSTVTKLRLPKVGLPKALVMPPIRPR